jgi:hypothetical protein
MFMASPERSGAMTARIGRLRVRRRNVLMALPSERSMNDPPGRRQDPFEVARESLVGREWDGRVACEVSHQARIEAAFDRVDACERLLGAAPRAFRPQARQAFAEARKLRPPPGEAQAAANRASRSEPFLQSPRGAQPRAPQPP